jgi:ABC-type sugar transport system ATPase subunit
LFAYLGPNGAGKSTTIKMLTTLLKPTEGTITLAGHNVIKEKDSARSAFGIVFQDPSLDDELTAYENMQLHAVLYHLQKPEQALAEFFRVLKPGGLVALRDACHSGDMMMPLNTELTAVWDTIEKVFSHQGGNIYFGSQHKELLLKQGFQNIKVSCSYDTFASDIEKDSIRSYWHQFLNSDHRQLILAEKWLTVTELEHQCNALDQWCANPASFFARARCEAIASK